MVFVFSSILKTLRTEKGVSQTQLAKEIGVSAGNIGDWEIGRSKPGYVALAALARFFEVSADYLLELSPEKTSEPPTELRGLDEIKASQGLTCDGLPLSEDEVDLVAMYRLLPPPHREEIFDLVYFKYKRHVEEKKESIYSTYFDGSEDEKSGPAGSREARDGTA